MTRRGPGHNPRNHNSSEDGCYVTDANESVQNAQISWLGNLVVHLPSIRKLNATTRPVTAVKHGEQSPAISIFMAGSTRVTMRKVGRCRHPSKWGRNNIYLSRFIGVSQLASQGKLALALIRNGDSGAGGSTSGTRWRSISHGFKDKVAYKTTPRKLKPIEDGENAVYEVVTWLFLSAGNSSP